MPRARSSRGCACIPPHPIAQTKPVVENHSHRVQPARAAATNALRARRCRRSVAYTLVPSHAAPRANGLAWRVAAMSPTPSDPKLGAAFQTGCDQCRQPAPAPHHKTALTEQGQRPHGPDIDSRQTHPPERRSRLATALCQCEIGSQAPHIDPQRGWRLGRPMVLARAALQNRPQFPSQNQKRSNASGFAPAPAAQTPPLPKSKTNAALVLSMDAP